MNSHSLFVDGDKRRLGINPAAGIVVVQSIPLLLHGDMGVSAEDAVGPVQTRVK
jgi:hypothetical protein